MRGRFVLTAWGAMATLATLATLSACNRSTQPPVAEEMAFADSAEQVLFDVRSLLTHRGVKRGEMFADTVFVFDDQTKFELRVVRANFSTETGAPNGTLRGDRGTYSTRTKVLEGFGNVVVTSTDGKRLTSNHLKFSENVNEIASDSAFVYREQDKVQRGVGFRTDPNLIVFRCLSRCVTEGQVELGNITP